MCVLFKVCYSRSLQNKHVATSVIFCKADDYSLEFVNGASRHYLHSKRCQKQNVVKQGTAGGNNMCFLRQQQNKHMATSNIFVRPTTAALSF